MEHEAGRDPAGVRRLNGLFAVLYDELHEEARRRFADERPDHTLQPTALIHEVYLRLAAAWKVDWQDRGHVMAAASREMRRILVDHARRHGAAKRGGQRWRITIDQVILAANDQSLDLVELDEMLKRLAELNDRHAQVVEMRFFGGMEFNEIARVFEVSSRTVRNDWTYASAWLTRELRAGE